MELLIKLLSPLIPTIFLLVGGQWLLNQYSIARRKKEQELELVKAIREQEYKAIEELYRLFGAFMELYRIVNADFTNLQEEETRITLFKQAAHLESQVDSLILKIGCEFANDSQNSPQNLEELLGNLRQSVQLWREQIREGKKLPFTSSKQNNYTRFKSAFANVSAFMINRIHYKLETPQTRMKQVEELLLGSFDNKYEIWGDENHH